VEKPENEGKTLRFFARRRSTKNPSHPGKKAAKERRRRQEKLFAEKSRQFHRFQPTHPSIQRNMKFLTRNAQSLTSPPSEALSTRLFAGRERDEGGRGSGTVIKLYGTKSEHTD
jgi:hypothetical protein